MTDLSLALAQDLSRLEVRPQVDEPHLAPGALDLADPPSAPPRRSPSDRRTAAAASPPPRAVRAHFGFDSANIACSSAWGLVS
jgi:hypothetical protein